MKEIPKNCLSMKHYKITIKHVLNTDLKATELGEGFFGNPSYPVYVRVICRRQTTWFPSKWGFEFSKENFEKEVINHAIVLKKEIEDVRELIEILQPEKDEFKIKPLPKLYAFVCRERKLVEYIEEVLRIKILEFGESLFDSDLVAYEKYKQEVLQYSEFVWKRTHPLEIVNTIFLDLTRNEIVSQYHSLVWNIRAWESILINAIRIPNFAQNKTYFLIDFINGEFEQDLSNYLKKEILSLPNVDTLTKKEALPQVKPMIDSMRKLFVYHINELKSLF